MATQGIRTRMTTVERPRLEYTVAFLSRQWAQLLRDGVMSDCQAITSIIARAQLGTKVKLGVKEVVKGVEVPCKAYRCARNKGKASGLATKMLQSVSKQSFIMLLESHQSF